VLNNEIYVIGGLNSDGEFLNDVWKSYDGRFWLQVTTDSQFTGRALHATVLLDNTIYIIGGYCSDGKRLNDVWSYTPPSFNVITYISINFEAHKENHKFITETGLNSFFTGLFKNQV